MKLPNEGRKKMSDIKMLLDYLLKESLAYGSREQLKKDTCEMTLQLNDVSNLHVRDGITGLGTILEENLTENYYITTVKVGLFKNVIAYALIVRDDEKLRITTYAREGLIRMKLSEKAMNTVASALKASVN